MAIQLLLSNSNNKAYKAFLDDFYLNYDKDKNYIVIVPDRYTLQCERDILEGLHIDGCFNIDVVSFTRLANKNLGKSNHALSPDGAVMLMSRAIENVGKDLYFFKSVYKKAGFIKDIYSTITAMRSSGITPELLRASIENMNFPLNKKSEDIYLIYNEYLKQLKESYSDGTSRLESLCKIIESRNNFACSEIYILKFLDFNCQMFNVIEKLAITTNVTIALASYARFNNQAIYPEYILRKIKNICKANSIKLNLKNVLEDNIEYKNIIEKHLFDFSIPKQKKIAPIEIYECLNKDVECERLAMNISKEIRINNVRYKELGVVCSNLERYKKSLIKYFEMYNIPYHLDLDEAICDHSFIRFILNGIKVILNNFKREDLFYFLKNPLLSINEKDVFELENYVIKYNINYAEIFNIFTLGNFEKAENVRLLIVPILEAFLLLNCNAKISNFIDNFKNIFEFLNIEDKLILLSEKEKNNEFFKDSEMSLHIYKKIINLLDEMKLILGESEEKLEDFYYILKNTISTQKMVLLPPSIDCIIVRELKNSSFDSLKKLYIIGANDGCFPQDIQDSAIINLKDAANLSSLNLELKPTTKDNLLTQKLEIMQLFLCNNCIEISYSMKFCKEEIKPSLIIKQLQNIFEINIHSIINPINFDAFSEDNFFYNKFAFISKKCLEHYFVELVKNNENIEQNNNLFNTINMLYYLLKKQNSNVIKNIYGEKTNGFLRTENLNLPNLFFTTLLKNNHENLSENYLNKNDNYYSVSVSQLEKYFECPFKHFLNYGLRLKERANANIKTFNIGNIVHTVLEEYFKNKNRDALNVESEVKYLINKITNSDEYIGFFKEKSSQILLRFIYIECMDAVASLLNYENNSSFQYHGSEIKINNNELQNKPFFYEYKLKNSTNNSIKIFYKGSIDRVDIFNKNILVIDYKTGKITSDLSNLYYGKKVQLYIYLSAITDGYKYIPCAVFYMPISSAYTNEKKKNKFLFIGQVIAENNIIEALDNTFFNNEFKSYIADIEYSVQDGFKKDKNGYFKNKNTVIDKEVFFNMLEYAKKLCGYAINEILEGYVECKPQLDACKYCYMLNKCFYEKQMCQTREKTKKINVDAFENLNFVHDENIDSLNIHENNIEN